MTTPTTLDLHSDELLNILNKELQPIFHLYNADRAGETCANSKTNDHKKIPVFATFPKDAVPVKELCQDIANRASEGLRPVHPGYFAFVPGGGIPLCAVANLVSDLINRFTGYTFSCPGLLELEVEAVKWIVNIVYGTKYPEAFGLLTSGGAMAQWHGMCAALSHFKQHYKCSVDKLVVYMSDQTHFCVPKTAKFCGATNIRIVPSNEHYQMNIAALQVQIEEDVQQGLVPAILVANVGAVNTGAIDDLQACAQVCNKYKMWFHADAAYAGFYLLCDSGKKKMQHVDLVDSIVLDPHKTLFLPYGTGCLIIKNKMHLKHTFGGLSYADYIVQSPPQTEQCSTQLEDLAFYDLSDLSMEGTRPFRGLRIWLPVKALGIDMFVQALEEKFALCNWAHAQLVQVPQVQIVTAPVMTIFTFRIVMNAQNNDLQIEQDSQQVLEHVNAKGRVFINNTKLRGKYVIRIIVNCFRTSMENVKHLVHDIREGINNIANK